MRKVILSVAVILTAISLTSCNDYRRQQDQLDAESEGKSILLKAESSKKADIEEAKARYESSKLDAQTKLIRAESAAQAKLINAKATAEANKIVGESLKGNNEYLKYLMINKMSGSKSRVYIPTEASLTIIEANK